MVELYYAPRKSGKTHRIIQQSAARNATIICPTKRDAERIKELAKRYNIHIPEPLPATEILAGNYFLEVDNQNPVLVDDADRIMSLLLSNRPILEATWTKQYPK
jgi:hypothetical protein